MRRALTALFAAIAVFGLTIVATADEPKAAKVEELKGSITCAKCDLGVETKCMTVIKVGDKVYYFDKDAHKKFHGDTCSAAKDGMVAGEVKKDGKKLIVTVKKLEYAK